MCQSRTLLVLFVLMLFVINPSFTQVTKEQAINIIMTEVVAGESLNNNVFLYKEQCLDEKFNLTPYDQIANPYDKSWLFFIDLMPEYGWGHPCKYIFVQESTGNYSILNYTIPPINYWLNWEEVSVPYPHQNVVQFTDTTFQMSSGLATDPYKYALLITCNAWDDQARWNNLSLVYTALKEKYGFKDENIFVLSGNGVFDPETMNLDLNGDDYDNDFDGACTKEKITEVIDYLDTTMTEEDIFLFYATTHGDATGEDTTSLRLNDSQPLFDYELAEMVDNLTCSQMVFSMDICNAGGMIDDLEGPHRVIQVPVPWGSLVWRGWTYFDFFTYGWGTAVRGFHPASNTEPWTKGDTIGKHPDLSLIYPYWNMPDTMPDLLSFNGNGDGFIQFGEAFNYIKYLDAEADSLGIEYQNHGFIGDLLTLNGIEGRVDTSQEIRGNFLIGRKLTLAPDVVLSDFSNNSIF
jgi:hypothetical protein